VGKVVLDNLVAAIGTRSNGVRQANYFVLRNTTMPAILVEVGYLSNPEEEANLKDPEFREKAAEGIFRGIAAYYGLPVDENGQPEQPDSSDQTEQPDTSDQTEQPEQPGQPDQDDRGDGSSRGDGQDPFSDISRHYARENIIWLTDLGIIQEEGRQFYPDRAITRAEMVAMLVRMLDLKSSSGASFSDVPSGYWAAEAIAAGKEAKLLTGYGDGRFCPDQPITRAETSTVMTRALELLVQAQPDKAPSSRVSKKFKDADNHWAKTYIYDLTSAGIIKGYDDGSFRPERSVTRGETVEFLARLLDPDQRL
jgi:hypothetical protein